MDKRPREISVSIEDTLMRLWMVTQEQLAVIKLQIREKAMRRSVIAERCLRTVDSSR